MPIYFQPKSLKTRFKLFNFQFYIPNSDRFICRREKFST